MTPTPVAGRSVPTRRISFEESLEGLTKHFAVDGDLILSHLAVSLSSMFPDGEEFFVRSVRAFRDEITDPDLKRQVAGFIGQETVHGREHRALNQRLDQLGYPAQRFERVTRRALAFRERVATKKSNLAATAGLEHFTAVLAELIMGDEEVRDLFGEPAVRDLFLWHALEESEHKAVAFDVYKAVGGSERTRVLTMKMVRFGFVAGLAVQIVISLLGDRATYRPGNLRRSWRRFRQSPLARRELWDQLRDYDRPDFHPDDRDTDGLLEHWRAELFGDEGTLNDKLVTRAVA